MIMIIIIIMQIIIHEIKNLLVEIVRLEHILVPSGFGALQNYIVLLLKLLPVVRRQYFIIRGGVCLHGPLRPDPLPELKQLKE